MQRASPVVVKLILTTSFLLAVSVLGLAIVIQRGNETVYQLRAEVNKLDNTVTENNVRLELGRLERTEYQYRQMLLGCNNEGAIASTNQSVRQLCDQELPRMLDQLIKLQQSPEPEIPTIGG